MSDQYEKKEHDTFVRFREFVKDKNVVIAQKLGVKPATVTNWRWRGIADDKIIALANIYDLDAHYIATGKRSAQSHVNEFIDNLPEVIIDDDETYEDMLYSELYDLRFCCGDGVGFTEFEPLQKLLPFDGSFFTKRRINPKNFKMVYAKGDSMAPYINEGDVVGMDISDIEPREGQVYAIWLDGDWMIKRIFKEGGGVLRLSSDNNQFRDKIIDASNGESLKIIGRVVYRSG